MAKTTYRELTPSKAFVIARDAEQAGQKYDVGEDDDGLTVTVWDNETYTK